MVRVRGRHISSIQRLSCQIARTVWNRTKKSQEPETHTWVGGSQVHGLSPAAFPDIFAVSCIRSITAGTQLASQEGILAIEALVYPDVPSAPF